MTADDVLPFRVEVPDEDLDDLRQRLRRTRWPDRETVEDWSQGVPLGYLQELCEAWRDDYDWRTTEARLNALPQLRTSIDGLGLHALHVPSPHPDALPLVLTHGWPGSVVELLDVIGPLTDPTAHGGRAEDAFTVVCPSLPGYGWSDKPAEPGWGVERIARAWSQLMARLGYDRFGAHGTDWGTVVSASLGQQNPEHVVGIHLCPPLAPPDPVTLDELTDAERAALADLARVRRDGSAYAEVHATRPQTVGYGLVDSPAGLCAWIVEKLWAWTDWDADLEEAVSRARVLDLVSVAWLTRTGASAARLYWESYRDVAGGSGGDALDVVSVPTGGTVFPKENPRTSRRWAQRRFPDIRHWGEPERGGHFPALEQPEVLVDELRASFRELR